ncbi:MAG: hypothetical protein ACI8PB_005533 [Desulforhopalus sp.]
MNWVYESFTYLKVCLPKIGGFEFETDVDKKVVSTHGLFGNGATLSVDSLETSINQTAPFVAGFLEVILIFKTCQSAPFLAHF